MASLAAAPPAAAETKRNTVSAAVLTPLIGFYALEYERVLCRFGLAFGELAWMDRATDSGTLAGPSFTGGIRLYAGRAPAGWWLFPEVFFGRRTLDGEGGRWSRGAGLAAGYAWESCCLVVSVGVGAHAVWSAHDLRSGDPEAFDWGPFGRLNLGLAF